MKHIIIIIDGMTDEPIPALGDRTPLQAAGAEAMNWIAGAGRTGELRTVPMGYEPTCEVTLLSLLGYALPKVMDTAGNYMPPVESLQQKYGFSRGGIIATADKAREVGTLTGLELIDGKASDAQAAIDALNGDYDFVVLHIGTCADVSEQGDYELKIKTISDIDKHVCRPLLDATLKMAASPVTIALLPGRSIPCGQRCATAAAVPFAIFHPGERPDRVPRYDEEVARYGMYGTMARDEFIKALFMK